MTAPGKSPDRLRLEAKWPHDEPLWQEIAKACPTVLLNFSRGKDSVAAWIALRETGLFKRIVPVFLYYVPDLSFEIESLDYAEQFFQAKIHRYPNPALYNMLHYCGLQPPDRVNLIVDLDIPKFGYKELDRIIREDLTGEGVGMETLQALGTRCSENLQRRRLLSKYGPWTGHVVKPIWNWSKQEAFDLLTAHRYKLPRDYDLWDKSFGGCHWRFSKAIKQHLPADWERIKFWFPLIEAEAIRHGDLSL